MHSICELWSMYAYSGDYQDVRKPVDVGPTYDTRRRLAVDILAALMYWQT